MSEHISTALIIGRWQLFHKGHESLLKEALNAASEVIVVIGSAYRSRDVRNPFTWEERKAMVQVTLMPTDLARVKFLPVRDYFDDERWNNAVRKGVAQLTKTSSKVVLLGFKKDASSYYLDNFPSWIYKSIEQVLDIDATSLRNVYFEGTEPDARLSVLKPHVSQKVVDYLQAWSRLPVYAQRMQEHLAVAAYRKRWTAEAYLTADAVVVVDKHVLLVRRGGNVGHGQWALPGGFVDKGERFYLACLRELEEETGLKMLGSTMKQACKAQQIFDHPLRSTRGRLITMAYFFDLGHMRLPEVKGADDAMEAKWIPLSELPKLEDQLFEDHAAILDKFVGVYE